MGFINNLVNFHLNKILDEISQFRTHQKNHLLKTQSF